MDIDDDDGRTYYCHTCEQEVSYAAYIDEEGAYQCVDCGDLFVEVRLPEDNSAPSSQPSRPQANPQPQPNQHQNQSFQWSFSMGDGVNHIFSANSNSNNNGDDLQQAFQQIFGNINQNRNSANQNSNSSDGDGVNSNNNGPPPPFGMFGNIFGGPQQQNGGPPPGFENIFNIFGHPRQPNQQNRNQQNQNQNQNQNQPNQNQNQNQNQNRPQNIEDLFEQLFPGMGGPRNNNNNNNNNQNQMPNNHPFVQLFRMPIINLNGMPGMNFGNMNMGDYAWGPMTQIIANLVDPNHHGPPPAAQSEIDALPELEVTQEMIDSDNVVTDCAVCKEEFQVSEKVLKLPCDHLYHRDCILPWLERHNTCPVCRFELGTDNEFYEQLRRQRDAQRNEQRDSARNNSNQNQPNGANQHMST